VRSWLPLITPSSGIHSMELKATPPAQLKVIAGTPPLNPFNGIERHLLPELSPH